MQANRRRDTIPEVELRSQLHKRGRRFRKDFRVALGSRSVRVDIAFPRQRIAVFVDGCFWHQCPEHGQQPRRNAQYWGPKLIRNVERDLVVNDGLKRLGWRVLRVWEHMALEEAVETVEREVGCDV
jgi:DNA mismatch endonuclease (patch repair protein)